MSVDDPNANDLPLSEITEMSPKAAGDLKTMFFLLADQSRLRILHYLMQRNELNVRSLCQLLGQSQPAVSHHLGLMRAHGLVACRREGKHNFYSIVGDRFRELLQTLFESLPTQDDSITLGGIKLTLSQSAADNGQEG